MRQHRYRCIIACGVKLKTRLTKLLAVAICITICFSLVACDSQTTSNLTETTNVKGTVVEETTNAEVATEVVTESAVVNTEPVTVANTIVINNAPTNTNSNVANNTTPQAQAPVTVQPVVTPVATHTHSWQPHYATKHVSDAWDEPVYQTVPKYEIHKLQNSTNLDLTVGYTTYVAGGGTMTWSNWFIWFEYGGFHTENVQVGTESQIVEYIHHQAVDTQYVDYYYCGLLLLCI